MPFKPLSFKGDKKPSKKRKHTSDALISHALTTTSHPSNDATTGPNEDDTWTSPSSNADLSGPILIVLPTPSAGSTPDQTQYSLASDPLGTIHPSPLHNLIENTAHTAEPDSTAQVWICTRLTGTNDEISLKAAHGAYLAADAHGLLSAKREARGPEEGWVVEEIPPGELQGLSTAVDRDPNAMSDVDRRFRLRASANLVGQEDDKEAEDTTGSTTTQKDGRQGSRYLSLELSSRGVPTLRADAAASSPGTQLIIRMQSRFKPSHQRQQSTKAREKVSRQELERVVGRRLVEDEVKRLKRARKEGTYHEEILDVRVKGKHDKFAS